MHALLFGTLEYSIFQHRVKKLRDSDFAHFWRKEPNVKIPSEIKPSLQYNIHPGFDEATIHNDICTIMLSENLQLDGDK